MTARSRATSSLRRWLRPGTSPSDRIVALALFIGVTLIYVALSRGMFLFGDDILMFQVTESIFEQRSVAVRSPTQTEAIAIDSDAGHSFNAAAIPGEDGRGYAKYGIGQSLIAIPAYLGADRVASLLPLNESQDHFGNDTMGIRVYAATLTNAVLGGAAIYVLFLLAVELGFRQATALCVALVAAFATPLAHYSGTFLSEPLSALAVSATALGLVRASAANAQVDPTMLRWLLLSGSAAGVGLLTKMALGVTLAPFALWVLWLAWRCGSRSRWGWLAICAAWGAPATLALLGIGCYNWSRFGSVTETGYGDEAGAYTTPLLTGVYGLLASPGRGLLWYAPPVLLGLFGAVWFRRRNPALALVTLAALAGTVLLYGRYYAWHGGGVWGPRFLVPLIPLLVLPAGELIARAWDRRRRMMPVASVVLLGLLVSALVLLVPFDVYIVEYTASAAAHDRAMWTIAGSPIVVHARDVISLDITPDIAGARYATSWLTAVSALTALLGATLLAVTCARAWPGAAPAAPE